ncbi:MAG TPA: hypothetical protein VMI92_08935 [Steroidobacteraceae bacterium]|nr:hypothetical protein [Steroidobacteraceae bacterium]
MPRVALLTARQYREVDEDLAPLAEALPAAGLEAHICCWDEAQDWSAFDLLLLRSTWDYMSRQAEFLAWAERASRAAPLANPLDTVRWNIDKHYLGALAGAGVPVIPTVFLEPGDDAALAIERFLAGNDCAEFVLKPAVGVGSIDAQRHARAARATALAHASRLLDAGRSALLQPYLARVDAEGESALVFFGGEFSHSIRKAALLRAGSGAAGSTIAPETIHARTASADELAVARQALAGIPAGVPLYARVDLLRDAAGQSRVLELELIEPSLFFAHAAGAAARFASCIARFLGRC